MKVESGYHGMGKSGIGGQCVVRIGFDGHRVVMVEVVGHFVAVAVVVEC